jgi:hypothetical protein
VNYLSESGSSRRATASCGQEQKTSLAHQQDAGVEDSDERHEGDLGSRTCSAPPFGVIVSITPLDESDHQRHQQHDPQ